MSQTQVQLWYNRFKDIALVTLTMLNDDPDLLKTVIPCDESCVAMKKNINFFGDLLSAEFWQKFWEKFCRNGNTMKANELMKSIADENEKNIL